MQEEDDLAYFDDDGDEALEDDDDEATSLLARPGLYREVAVAIPPPQSPQSPSRANRPRRSVWRRTLSKHRSLCIIRCINKQQQTSPILWMGCKLMVNAS